MLHHAGQTEGKSSQISHNLFLSTHDVLFMFSSLLRQSSARVDRLGAVLWGEHSVILALNQFGVIHAHCYLHAGLNSLKAT